MSRKPMFSKLRSRYARFVSPIYGWCSCTSVKEPHADEPHNQTWAGRQASSHQAQPQWETTPASSTACCAANCKTKPEVLVDKSSTTSKITVSLDAHDEQVQDDTPAPISETINLTPEGVCNVTSTPKPEAEPPTPLGLSPGTSRKLSQTSEESQDGESELTASVETSGEPAAGSSIQALASIKIDIDSSSSSTTTTITTNTNTSITSSSGNFVAIGCPPDDVAAAAVNVNQDHLQEDKYTPLHNTASVYDSSKHGWGFDYEGHAFYLQQIFVPLLLEQLQLGDGLQEAAATAAQRIDDYLTDNKCTLNAVVNAYPYTTGRCSDW